MGKVEQSTDWVNDTGSKLYYFPSINAGTLGMIDVKHNWAGGAKNLAPGAQLKNLCFLDDPASVGSVALNFDSTSGGLVFDKTSRQYLRLPAGFIPTAAMKDYM
ncbi:hypothetical protein ELE64_32045, partial [Klebsiella pneumoniae]|nr:hypothetical protein [Klebsiella pneumoniae]